MPFIKHDLKNEDEQNKRVLNLSNKMFCFHRSTVKVEHECYFIL